MAMATRTDSGRAAVYRLFASDGTLLYVGSAFDPEERYACHRKAVWWPSVSRQSETWFSDRKTAYREEWKAIASEQPTCNLAGPLLDPSTSAPSGAKRQHDERARMRHRAQSESHRVRKGARDALVAAGVHWAEADQSGREAAIDFMDATGLFRGYVARQRQKRLASE